MSLPNKYEMSITVTMVVKEVDSEPYKVRELLTIEARNEAVTTSPSATVDVFRALIRALMYATDKQAADELGRVVMELKKRDEERRRADETRKSAVASAPPSLQVPNLVDTIIEGTDPKVNDN